MTCLGAHLEVAQRQPCGLPDYLSHLSPEPFCSTCTVEIPATRAEQIQEAQCNPGPGAQNQDTHHQGLPWSCWTAGIAPMPRDISGWDCCTPSFYHIPYWWVGLPDLPGSPGSMRRANYRSPHHLDEETRHSEREAGGQGYSDQAGKGSYLKELIGPDSAKQIQHTETHRKISSEQGEASSWAHMTNRHQGPPNRVHSLSPGFTPMRSPTPIFFIVSFLPHDTVKGRGQLSGTGQLLSRFGPCSNEKL